jgi:hypothetical protein
MQLNQEHSSDREGWGESSGRDDDGGGGGQGLEDGQRYQPHCHLPRDGEWQVKPLRDTEYCTKIWKHMRSQSPSSLALAPLPAARSCPKQQRRPRPLVLFTSSLALGSVPLPPAPTRPWTEKPFV